MRERYDVVFLYAPPWAGPTRFSKHHLARLFAEDGHRVLYVEAPLTPLAVRRGRGFFHELHQTMQAPARTAERLWVRRHFLPLPYHAVTRLTETRWMNRVGQRWLAPRVRADMRQLGFDRPLIVAGLPHTVDALAWLPRRCLVYHCSDDLSSVRGFPRSLPRLEAALSRQADLVIATSETLATERQKHNPRTYWVPNGAEIEHFSQPAAPTAELCQLPKPVIGFVGGLSQWVDLELVRFLARERPAWSFVLVGPGTAEPSRNVHPLGPKPYETLPSYLAAMDVGLIPFRQDPVTHHADPIKAYEYLAAGLPVVATDLPALRRLAHVVRLASTREAFVAELDAAVAEGRDAHAAERQAEAARHSWRSRFADVKRLIDQTCGS